MLSKYTTKNVIQCDLVSMRVKRPLTIQKNQVINKLKMGFLHLTLKSIKIGKSFKRTNNFGF